MEKKQHVFTVKCSYCGSENRVPCYESLQQQPVCGRCRRPLKNARLSNIKQLLHEGKRLPANDVIWLKEQRVLFGDIATLYHRNEGQYYEEEYQRTGNLWNLVNASSQWRKAGDSQRAVTLTQPISIRGINNPKLKAALLTTRGGALRDVNNLILAEVCALKAICFQHESYRPYNLMGAVYYDRKDYDEGDMWFEEAVSHGATSDDVDTEIRRIIQRTTGRARQQLLTHLLHKDPLRYSWVKKEFAEEKQAKKEHSSKTSSSKKAASKATARAKKSRPSSKKTPRSEQTTKTTLPEIFTQLINVMKDGNGSRSQWMQFTILNKQLKDKGLVVQDHQYAKFKAFMLDAQEKGVVVIRNQGNLWEAKLV